MENSRVQTNTASEEKCIPNTSPNVDNKEKRKNKSGDQTVQSHYLFSSQISSAFDENEVNKESLSATSGSLSSLSPPSSPGKLKSEIEKQEEERNEKLEDTPIMNEYALKYLLGKWYRGTAARKRIEPTRLQGNNHLS
ncbi:hypothetical protein GEV33_002402 [Tenebrio molitor]|uniref:Uncharacterized protein n=1 Tax=Tenebrio molitor TaxID=7067 RepID=A0A8J6LEW3_TENMO|nr:hypothetical protein GEV33_002402 [Tenebrio molitor]